MEPTDLAFQGDSLFRESGPDGDVVLSTRVRLARNVADHQFPNRLRGDERRALEVRLRHWIEEADLAEDLHYCNLTDVRPLTRQVFMERHLISRELAQGSGERGVSFAARQLISIMTNEEDHLRIQVLRPGRSMKAAFETAQSIDERLERLVPYAFDEQFGYLTACPSNLGTGLRVSVMAHLPGIVSSKQLDKMIAAAARLGLTVRGFYGEGSKVVGDVVQISNQRTLGISEQEILSGLQLFIPKVISFERSVRDALHDSDRLMLEDKVWRAVGMLRYARRLTGEETMEYLSAVRLGLALEMLPSALPGLHLGEVNELFVMTQPGHIQMMRGKDLDPEDRDIARAALLRQKFQPESN